MRLLSLLSFLALLRSCLASPSSKWADVIDAAGSASRALSKPVSAGWWAVYHKQNMTLDQIPWSLYTHMSYFVSVTPNDTNKVSFTSLGDEITEKQLVQNFSKQAHEHNVTALLTIGGYTGSTYFSSLVATADNRTAFAAALLDVVHELDLDGLDFDWEYPNKNVSGNLISAGDTPNFLEFLKTLRLKGGQNLTLTAAVGNTPWNDASAAPSTNVSEFAHVLDYVAIMNYDVNGQGWSPVVGPNAPLHNGCNQTVYNASAEQAVHDWTAAGFPPERIVLGVAAYGHGYNVSIEDAFAGPNGSLALYSPFNNSAAGLVSGDAWDGEHGGTFSFRGLVGKGYLTEDGSPADGVAYLYDKCSETPYIYENATGVMVSYDDATSFKAKGQYVKDNKLAGFAMFEAAGDYNNILLNAIREGAGLVGSATTESSPTCTCP